MVGGKVSIVTDRGDRVEVSCVGTGPERYDRCATCIKKEGRWGEIKAGFSE